MLGDPLAVSLPQRRGRDTTNSSVLNCRGPTSGCPSWLAVRFARTRCNTLSEHPTYPTGVSQKGRVLSAFSIAHRIEKAATPHQTEAAARRTNSLCPLTHLPRRATDHSIRNAFPAKFGIWTPILKSFGNMREKNTFG